MIDIGEFKQVDTARAADLIRYLEAANALLGVQRCKQVALAELGLRPGQAVLEAGSGYGADVADMASLVSLPWPGSAAVTAASKTGSTPGPAVAGRRGRRAVLRRSTGVRRGREPVGG